MRALPRAVALIAVLIATPALSQATTTYLYDDLGRLKNVAYTSKNIAYNYDPAGNRTSVVTQTNTPHVNAGAAAKTKKHKRKH